MEMCSMKIRYDINYKSCLIRHKSQMQLSIIIINGYHMRLYIDLKLFVYQWTEALIYDIM